MLVIRFSRRGKKNQASYKIVVVDSKKSSTAGSFTEQVGSYNPITKEKVLNSERIKYWISVGAQPSDTVHNLLVSEKIIDGDKVFKFKKSRKKVEEKVEVKPEKPVEEKKEEKLEIPAEEKPEISAEEALVEIKPADTTTQE